MTLTSTSVSFLCLVDFIFLSSLQVALKNKEYIIKMLKVIMSKNTNKTSNMSTPIKGVYICLYSNLKLFIISINIIFK